jgi:hypothetical protein
MRIVYAALAMAIVLILGAHPALAADTDEVPSAAGHSMPAVITPKPGDEVPEPPPQKYGDGMQIPVNGTSLEAFDESLAFIKTKSTKPEYTSLQKAIEYLMVYYIDARGNKTKLAALLDGKTGEQIIDMVEWQH